MSEPEKKYMAIMEKNKGNEAFKSKDYYEAYDYYTKSLELFKDPRVYSNRAAVSLKQKLHKKCVEDCNVAIGMDRNFLKPYNRRAQANTELKNYGKAIEDYQFILTKDPDNKAIPKKLKRVR